MALQRLKFVFFVLLLFSESNFAADGLHEDMTKALIVRQLVGLIDWQHAMFDQKPSKQFKICSFRDEAAFQLLNNFLKGESINQKTLQIKNVVNHENVASCHAIFINTPDNSDLSWFVNNRVPQQTLFIVRGKRQARKGFHFGIYLNNQNSFDLELNPDAFIHSRFMIGPELLQLAKVLTSSLESKISLLRSLINYTDWPGSQRQFTDKKIFNLCSWQNKSLAMFLDYYARNKSFKNRKLNVLTISESKQASSCDAIVIDRPIDSDSISLLSERNQQKVLLIGNFDQLGEKGVHYNLNPLGTGQNRRFEMNLVAFDKTGHSPHFELFNSAIVVEKDLPEYSRIIANIIEFTAWPNGIEASASENNIDLCVYRDPQLFDNVRLFIAEREAHDKPRKSITTKLIFDELQLNQCQAFLVSGANEIEHPPVLVSDENRILMISSKTSQDPQPFHYRVLTAPKRVTFEFDLDKLRSNGFRPSQSLLSLGKVITSGGQP